MIDASYDVQADALYVGLRAQGAGESAWKTLEVLPGVHLDLDSEGHPVGLEVLNAGQRYPLEALMACEVLPSGLMPLSQAATRAGLSPQTLKVQAIAGRLRAVKLGRHWVTTEPWLDDYLTSRARGKKRQGA